MKRKERPVSKKRAAGKGRAADARYNASEKGRARNERYEASGRGRATRGDYESSHMRFDARRRAAKKRREARIAELRTWLDSQYEETP
jgi:hypothetical protein